MTKNLDRLRFAWWIAFSAALLTGCGGDVTAPSDSSESPQAVSSQDEQVGDQQSDEQAEAEGGDSRENGADEPRTDASQEEPAAGDAASAAQDGAAVSLETVDVDGYEKAIAEHQGKVVLVDFWATWCLPCLERFPETVQWSEEYADDGLAVISMSLDEPDAAEAAASFLKQKKAGFRHLRSTWGTGLESTEKFQIQGGGVPYYKLYDRSGKLRYEFSGNPEGLENVEPLEKIEDRLKELLAEPAA